MCLFKRKLNIYKITWKCFGTGTILIVAKNEQQAIKKFNKKHHGWDPIAVELYFKAK